MSDYYIHCEMELKQKFPFYIENILTRGNFIGLLSSNFELFSLNEKLFSKKLRSSELLHLNEFYVAHTQRDFFDGLWLIEIYQHGNYENPLDSIALKTSIFPAQFCMYDHYLGSISYNSLYYITFSVFDLQRKEEIKTISLKKFDPDNNPNDWVFHYFTPFIELTDKYIIVTTGLSTCHFYSFCDDNKTKTITVDGKITKIISNTDFLIVFSHSVSAQYTLINLETFDKQVFPTEIDLYDSQLYNMMDISSEIFAYYYNNKIEIFDFTLDVSYQHPLPKELKNVTALSVKGDKIFIVTYDNNAHFSSILEFTITRTSFHDLQLVLHKTSLGPFSVNYDVKSYISEFFGKIIRKGQRYLKI